MRYISTFSGVEAATLAWRDLGWEAVAFSEVDEFPSAVLQERFPEVPNLGDVTKVEWSDYRGSADVVVGGSPCQSFSIAGGRTGLDGASGLMWEYVRCVREVIFDAEGLRRDFEPGREKREALASASGRRPARADAICMTDTQPHGMVSDEICGCLSSTMHKGPPVTMKIRGGKPGGGKGPLLQTDMSATLATSNDQTLFEPVPIDGYEVRKLTPRECERLMGMPDDWTRIPYRGKPAEECPDGPRYRAIGNSMAVPVMRWIGERVEMVGNSDR